MTRLLAVLALGATTLVASARQPPTCDLLISSGRIVDGTGAPWFAGDVCVSGGRITSVRDRDTSTATRRIDARGLVVSPGFIDMLGQSEYWVLRDSRVGSTIMQGITTELTGEASFSSAAHDRARQLHPFAAMFDQEGVPAWLNLAGYLAVLDQRPATINLGTFISAGGVRESVAGRDDRAATAAELTAMEAQVAAAMEAGAFGVSTSLQYVPDASRAPTNSWPWRGWRAATAAATSRTNAPKPMPSTRASTRCSASPARPACRPSCTT